MGINLVDRDRLQATLEEDLGDFLRVCLSRGPVREPVSFRIERQLADLNRKSNDLGVTRDLATQAFARFSNIQTELAQLQLDENRLKPVRDLLWQWLPPLERVWDDIWDCCAFGPGTVFHARGPHERSLLWKIGANQTVTAKAYWLAVDVIGRYYPRFASRIRSVQRVRGNRITHVAKDVRKCRQIAVEPSLNVFLQKGVGEWMVRHMARRGIADLSTGQELHRSLVRDFETWATIDLSDASDRISKKLVKELLPPDWFYLLDTLRSHEFLWDGKWGTYESFTSQGNAFTFPLETMIFKAIAVCVSSGRTSVYGDDIIVPLGDAVETAAHLESFGFTVNTEKSYWGQHDGDLKYFRESCGEDTLRGYSVRSVFFKDPALSFSDVAALGNMLFEKWGYLPRTHYYLQSLIPRERLNAGPRFTVTSNGYGDNVISTEYSSWCWDDWLIDPPPKTVLKCPQLQTTLRVVKFWSHSVSDLPARYRLTTEDQLMAFLYSGSPYSSPLGKPRTRKKVVVTPE